MTDAPGGDNRIPISDDRSLNGSLGKGGLSSRRPELSPRETTVAALVATGQTNLRIAVLLGISQQTVKNALTHIYAKLGMKNRTQLALYMLRCNSDENVIRRRLMEYVG